MQENKKNGKFSYIELEIGLRAKIMSGAFNPKIPLPGENCLAEQFGISRPSVRKALSSLEKEGLLSRKRGLGTFVVPPEQRRKLSEVNNLHIAIGVSWLNDGLDEYENRFLEGAAEYANRAGHKLSYFDSVRFDSNEIIKQFKLKEVNAIIWASIPTAMLSTLNPLINAEIPQIILHHQYKGIPYLTCNYRKAVRKSFEILTKIGYEKVGFINCSLIQFIYDEYEQAFKDLFQKNHIKLEDYYIRISNHSLHKEFASRIEWLKSLDAILLGGHSFLIPLLNCLSANNINIPEDLAIICFDDSVMAKTYKVPVSVYEHSRAEQGKQAIYCIEALLAGKIFPEERIINQGELIIRDSC